MLGSDRYHNVYEDGKLICMHQYKWGEEVLCYLDYKGEWYKGIFITHRNEDSDPLICSVCASDMPIDYLPVDYVKPLRY